MPSNLAEAATSHHFPPVFFRFPRLLALVHLLMRLTTLRVWYVRRAFRRVLGRQPRPFTLVDAGCGHGDYLLPAARRYPDSRFVGVDKIEDNVRISSAYARARGIANAVFVCDHVERFDYAGADVVACIGVMELVEDDGALLRRFREGMQPDGVLMLYQPVLGRRLLPFYESALARLSVPYHVVQQRQHVYTPAEVERKLSESGFSVASVTYSFGPVGRLYYETYNLLMYALLSAHWILYPVLVPLFVACMPLFWLLMGIDYAGRRSSGNGMMIVARPSTGESGTSGRDSRTDFD